MKWDTFISHAEEDKATFAKPLAQKLKAAGVKVWYDEFALRIGDGLSKSIDEGLSNSNFGVIVISPSFITKGWTEYELRSFINLEIGFKKVILPVWHNIDKAGVQKFSPFLADKFALDTAKLTLDEIAIKIIEVARPDIFQNLQRRLLFEQEIKKSKPKVTKNYNQFHSIIYHSELPNDIINRIALFHQVIGEATGISLSETIDNFKCDMNPERELQVWEAMSATYLEIIKTYKISDSEIQKEIYRILLGYSMGIAPTQTRFAKDDVLFTILNAFKSHFPQLPRL